MCFLQKYRLRLTWYRPTLSLEIQQPERDADSHLIARLKWKELCFISFHTPLRSAQKHLYCIRAIFLSFKFKIVIYYTCSNAVLGYLCNSAIHLVVYWHRFIEFSRYFGKELVKSSAINYVSGDKDGDIFCRVKKKCNSSVYDCTVEDVEYICNKFSLSVTLSRHLVVIILRCCARRAIL